MIQLVITVIIVIVIILILFINKKTDTFAVNTSDVGGTTKKDISETYDYSTCVGCVTTNNKLKPMYKYNISDSRCVKNNTYNYMDKTTLDNIQSYTSLPTTELTSCYNNYNSVYSSVNGRYIILFRTDNIKMKFNHISVHERDTTKLPITDITIFTTNLEKVNNAYIYPETVLNSTISNTITFTSGSFSYTVLKILSAKDIGYINIKHTSDADATTLNGAVLVVLKDPDAVDNITGRVMFYTMINTNDRDRIIYTYNHLNSPLPEYLSDYMPIINNWIIPCDNCTSSNGKLFQWHYYSTDPNNNNIVYKCYRPIDNTLTETIFDSVISDNTLTTKFITCSPDFDTRYEPPIGKFIQIKRNDSRDIGIVISKIQIYSDYLYSNTDLSYASALVNSYSSPDYLFGNALDDSNSTLLKTTNNRNSFIHIDIGTNTNIHIAGMLIQIPITERYNIVGLKCLIVSVDESDIFNTAKMKLTSEVDITSNFVQTANTVYGDTNYYMYLIPFPNNRNVLISTRPDIIINNNVPYNTGSKYLTTYKKGIVYYQIPYTIYNISNGRTVMAKSLTDVTNTLDKVSVSDAVTLLNIPNGTDLSSIINNSDSVPSYILNPISARYIQIKSNGVDTLNGVISSIDIYDSNSNIIKSIIDPVILYEAYAGDYEMYISAISESIMSDGFILIDLNIDTAITFIVVTVNVTEEPKLYNAVLNLIDNNGTRLYTYTFYRPKTINYLITDVNEISETDLFFVNKYHYPNCLDTNICNNIAPSTYYISDDGRCYKSKDESSLVPCTEDNCMSTLLDYSKNNKIAFVDNNFISCLDGLDTRMSGVLVVHFDASIASTVNTDANCSRPASAQNDFIRCWKSTSQGYYSNISAVQRNNANPMLTTFTKNTKAIDIMVNQGGGYYEYVCDMTKFKSVTAIAVFKITTSASIVGHPLGSNAGYIRYNTTQVSEQFYTSTGTTGISRYQYVFPTFTPLIYVVTADYASQSTNCYRYVSNLIKLNSVALQYSTNIQDSSSKYIGSTPDWGGYNYLALAEIKIYGNVLNDEDLIIECEALKTKWNVHVWIYDVGGYNAIFSIKNLVETYTGPIFKLRRSTDNVLSDFYDKNNDGILMTSSNVLLTDWMAVAPASQVSPAILYIDTWYNQTGNNYNAIQSILSNQPKLILTNNGIVNVKINGSTATEFLNLPNNTIPSGNNNYAIGIHTATLNNTYGNLIHSGEIRTSTVGSNGISITNNLEYAANWNTSSTVYTYGSVLDNNISILSYDSTKLYSWVQSNGPYSSTAASNRNSLSTNNIIGYVPSIICCDANYYSIFILNKHVTSDNVAHMYDTMTDINAFV